ncbi:DUF3013 family protein [Lapidilactobacillus mulanensis]|uniref:DUF3013 family protein n=1 Tax=Lapidilactobacillus mulanensis TaxID=2485999 RepID=A0ABW4DPM1_9LACO|nr:DUF3013 family protein [Lapidilactobacillus mulanensis]
MDMLKFFDEQIEALDFAGDLNVNWDQSIRSFELEIVMTGQTNQLEIEDQEGAVQDDEVQYDDAILIYDETKVDGNEYADNYLTVLPFNGRQGMPKAIAQGLFNYLKDLLDDGMSDFLDFLDPDMSVATFQLDWDQTAFMQYVQKAEDQGVNETLSYPRY